MKLVKSACRSPCSRSLVALANTVKGAPQRPNGRSEWRKLNSAPLMLASPALNFELTFHPT